MVLRGLPGARRRDRRADRAVTAPRLEIDLDKVEHNTRVLVDRLAPRGHPGHRRHQGRARLARGRPRRCSRGGAVGLGDSRVENLARLAGLDGSPSRTLIRSPMLSQVDARGRAPPTSA